MWNVNQIFANETWIVLNFNLYKAHCCTWDLPMKNEMTHKVFINEQLKLCISKMFYTESLNDTQTVSQEKNYSPNY